MCLPDGWIKIDKGFYIIDQSGSSPDSDLMKIQADEMYKEIKKIGADRIKFIDIERSETERNKK